MTDDAAARVAEQIIHSLPTTESLCVADYKEVVEYLRAYGDQREREALERAARAIDNAEAGGDCEYNKGNGGPDGGCSLRGDCLCGHWNEALDKAKAKVLALIAKLNEATK